MLNGKRGSTTRRVPYSAAGNRFGTSAIWEMACATSWAKATAITGLRSSYQFRASTSSTRAAGWNLTVIPAAEELFPNFFPRNRLDGAGIELRHAASDLA